VLVVGTGPNGPSTLAGLPADLLPATMNGTTSLRSLTGLATFFEGASNPTGPWLMATLKVGDGAALASDENQPLVVVGRRGKGTVFMFALSPAQPPFRGWDGADRVWSYMLSYTSLAPTLFSTGSRQEFGWGRVPREALTQGGAGLGPESLLLLGGLIFFAVVIGPLNVLILSRLGRRDLALVTIPVLSILSTLGAVVYANNHRQGDVMVNQVSLVRTWDGTGIGQLHSFVGVFALHSQHFPVMVPANSLMSTTVYPFQGQFARTVPNVKVLQTDSPEEQGLDVEPGALNSFILDGHLHSDGKIISSIQLENDQLVGQITNGLPITIRDAAIVAGNSVQSIGELKPGASHAVALPVGGGSPVGFQDNGQVIDKLFPGTSHETGAHHDVRYDILSAALNPSQTFSGQVELSGLNLIGWLGDSVDPVSASDTGRQSHQQTVFITNLAVHLPASLQTIPSQIIERQSLLTSSSARTDANGVAINTGDSAAFQFTAPIDPGHFALRSMTLVTASDNDPSGVLEFFNWRTQVWDTISFAPGNLAIPTPDRYFSPTGLVRLRFRYKSAPAPMGASTLTFNKFQLLIGGVGR
jgi:hypothetical protein